MPLKPADHQMRREIGPGVDDLRDLPCHGPHYNDVSALPARSVS